tara:strand:- start:122 stop:391 length:270 start_codon:yes stop_codon:yes gene_type:complete
MKKYSEQYVPLTRDELTKLKRACANFDPKYLREYATAHQHESDDMVIKSALNDALNEIEYLRGLLYALGNGSVPHIPSLKHPYFMGDVE